jgi:hypothetical protein
MLRKLFIVIIVARVRNVIIRVVVLLVVFFVLQDGIELRRRRLLLNRLRWVIQNVVHVEVVVRVRVDRIHVGNLLLRVAARVYQVR